MQKEVEINVVSSMSAGKSTLINAFLHEQILPVRNVATTSKLTFVHNARGMNTFDARSTDEHGQVVETNENIDNRTLEEMSWPKDVYAIELDGDAHFIEDEMARVTIVDTPGFVGWQDTSYLERTKDVILNQPKTLVLYVMNGIQLGTNDEDYLLTLISESMQASKENRDRFFFVVNKLDTFGKEDDINVAFDDVRVHLSKFGIENPQLFATSAKTALGVRTLIPENITTKNQIRDLRDDAEDEGDEQTYEAAADVLKVVKQERLHMPQYSTTSLDVQTEIEAQIENAQNEDNYRELALLYSGVPVLELAIQKYINEDDEIMVASTKEVKAPEITRGNGMLFTIEYNPVKRETIFKKNGAEITDESSKFVKDGKWAHERLQTWIDELADALKQELNSREIELNFVGVKTDADDVREMVESVNAANDMHIQLTVDQRSIDDNSLNLIQGIYEDIQNAPYDELKTKKIDRAYTKALNDEFEVNVIATMSAGKSTLLNSLLQKQLLPARNQATTAKITRIRDNDNMHQFDAKIFDESGKVTDSRQDVDYTVLDKMNSAENVYTVELEGNVPFVDDDSSRLVLVDTPGPNNSQDLSHLERTKDVIVNQPKTLVLYVMNGTQLGTNDENSLLTLISESMQGSKENRDRFFFVVNKLDTFGKEDDINVAFDDVRVHLAKFGIENPQLFAASAKTALGVRTLIPENITTKNQIRDLRDDAEDEGDEEVYDVANEVLKLVKQERLHMQQYSVTTTRIKNEINERIEKAVEEDNYRELALLYSGIPTIEAAIRLYVEKYAKSAKIRTVVDSFQEELKRTNVMATLKRDISENTEKQEAVQKQINDLKARLDMKDVVSEFDQRIDGLDMKKPVETELTKIIRQVMDSLVSKQEQLEASYEKVDEQGLERLTQELNEYGTTTQIDAATRIKKVVDTETGKLLDDMQASLKSIIKDVDDSLQLKEMSLESLSLDTVNKEQLQNQIADQLKKTYNGTDNVVEEEVRTKTETHDEEYDTGARWYKPWSWGKSRYATQTVEETIEYTEQVEQFGVKSGADVIGKFFLDFGTNIEMDLIDSGKKLATQVQTISRKQFKDAVVELQASLRKVMHELEQTQGENAHLEQVIADNNKKLTWLNEIETRLLDAIELK